MTSFATSFETGTLGTSAAAEFSSTTLGGGTVLYSTAHEGDGTKGAAFTQSGTGTCYGDVTGFNSTSMTAAFVFYYAGVPTALTRIFEARTAVGVSFAVAMTTAGALRIQDDNTTIVVDTTTILTPGHFYRIHVGGTSDATAGTIQLRIYDGAQSTALVESLAATSQNTRGGSITTARVGITSATAFGSTFYVDSLQYLDGTAAPLGPYTFLSGAAVVQLDDGTGTWPYDITQYVSLQAGVVINRGREDEYAQVQPSQCTLTLDNTDGRFTVGSAFYPIDVGTPIRVSAIIGAATFPRFTGNVNAWPVEWPTGGDSYSSVTITATDRQATLERITMRQKLYDRILDLNPDAYYPMDGDSDRAVRNWSDVEQYWLVENESQNGLTADIAIQYDSIDGPGNYGVKAPAFKRTAGCLRHNPMLTPLVAGNFTIGLFIDPSNNAPTGGAFDYPLVLHSARDNANLTILVDQTTGVVQCTQYDNDTGVAVNNLFGGYVMDGAIHQVTVVESGTHRTIYTDGFAGDTAVINIPVTYAYDYLVGWRWFGSISHFFWGPAIPNPALTTLQLWLDGIFVQHDYAGSYIIDAAERVGFDSVLDINTPAIYPTDYGTTAVFPINTEGLTAADAMRTWATAEGGLWFIDASGRLTFHTRLRRYDASAVVSLPADKVGVDTRFVLDDQHLVNDATVTTRDGHAWHYLDQASVDKYGRYQVSEDTSPIANLNATGTVTDDALLSAEARVVFNTPPAPRVSSTSIDVLTFTTADQVSMMAVELGSRITLTGLPAQAPASLVDLFAEGWTETISLTEWTLNLNTSPGNHFQVWKLEDPIYGVLGSTTVLAY